MGSRYKIGLALSGGGARGFAHCGALLALEEFGLKPDLVCGTSAGAIAGAMYCAGRDPFAIAEAFMGKEFTHFVKLRLPQSGLFDHEPLLQFIQSNLGGKSFEDLEIPMWVMTSDFNRGRSRLFKSGDLAKCVLASASVPVVFKPVEIGGVYYVDGGLFKNFPVSPIKYLCDKIIGVNVDPMIADDYKHDLFNIAMRSFHFMATANATLDAPLCDILIDLKKVGRYTMFDLKNINTIFKLGYTSTVVQLERVYKLERQLPSRLRDLIAPAPEEGVVDGIRERIKILIESKV